MTRRWVYAWICQACNHPSSEHRLIADKPVEGPYACRLCDCEMMQSDPQHGVDREAFDRLTKGT